MKICDKIVMVINGDWNLLFTQGEWVAKNVFECEQMQVRMNVNGGGVSFVYNHNDVSIIAQREKIVFTADNLKPKTLKLFCKCVNNFIRKSYTPVIASFGINTDFIDDDMKLSEMFNKMEDAKKYKKNGLDITFSKLQRVVRKNKDLYNVESVWDKDSETYHINKHYEGYITKDNFPEITIDFINDFIDNCWDIMEALGYERNDEDINEKQEKFSVITDFPMA